MLFGERGPIIRGFGPLTGILSDTYQELQEQRRTAQRNYL
jgi:hypothetical protein